MAKQYNIVWAIVDSVRHYHTPGDDRTRLDFMDEFAKDSVEFKHVITSAPSTVMSISAMMTSMPSFYLGRNYSDFRFDNNYFSTLSSILKLSGWESRALLMHPDIRDKLRVFDLISSKYWPKGFSHKNWWNNSQINELLRNSLKIDGDNSPNPCFWFLDFNCREDPETSNIVKDSFQALKDAGYNEDNTIFILCSDHGYPDPSRGITPEYLKENNLTHDIFMTEDNIRIPLFISYPGCKKGSKVSEIISTLDLTPTILDLLEIKVDEEISSRWHGKSLLRLMNQDNSDYDSDRLIRVDARFFGQPGRISAMCGTNYKYVYHHDTNHEEFFDLSNYLQEEKNLMNELSSNPELNLIFQHFKKSFHESELNGSNFQINYAVSKLSKSFNDMNLSNTSNLEVLVIAPLPLNMLSSIAAVFKSFLNDPNITIVTSEQTSSAEKYVENIYFAKDSGKSVVIDGADELPKFDLCILVSNGESSLIRVDSNKQTASYNQKEKKLASFAKSLKPKKIISLDLNMTLSINKGQISRYFKTLLHKKEFFLEEPSLIFFEVTKIFKVLKRKVLNRLKKL